MKFTKQEILFTFLLTILSLIGHYYLSWHCTLAPVNRYIGKFVWISIMVGVGYWGLRDNQVTWVAALWLILNGMLMIGFGVDKLLIIRYHQEAFFRINSNQFTSPIPFIATCIIPRLFVSQYKKRMGR